MTIRLIVFASVGAVLGVAYHKFVGCRTGACPIAANPYISIAYGAILGLLFGGGIR